MIKKSAISGEHIITIEDSGTVRVGKITDNIKSSLREAAEAKGFEYDPGWTTRQFGSKLIKEFGEGNMAEIGEYTIVKRDDESIESYCTCANTLGALREIAAEVGFEINAKSNTRQNGSKLVDFINANSTDAAPAPTPAEPTPSTIESKPRSAEPAPSAAPEAARETAKTTATDHEVIVAKKLVSSSSTPYVQTSTGQTYELMIRFLRGNPGYFENLKSILKETDLPYEPLVADLEKLNIELLDGERGRYILLNEPRDLYRERFEEFGREIGAIPGQPILLNKDYAIHFNDESGWSGINGAIWRLIPTNRKIKF